MRLVWEADPELSSVATQALCAGLHRFFPGPPQLAHLLNALLRFNGEVQLVPQHHTVILIHTCSGPIGHDWWDGPRTTVPGHHEPDSSSVTVISVMPLTGHRRTLSTGYHSRGDFEQSYSAVPEPASGRISVAQAAQHWYSVKFLETLSPLTGHEHLNSVAALRTASSGVAGAGLRDAAARRLAPLPIAYRLCERLEVSPPHP